EEVGFHHPRPPGPIDGRADDAAALLPRDALHRVAVVVAGAAAHLDEGDGPILGGHEVHLSAAAVVVARQDLPSSLLEEGGGDRLGGVPALAPLLGPRRSMPHAASTTTAAFRKVPTSVRWTICTPCPANHWRAFASLCWSSGASSSKGASSTKGPPEASVTAKASAARAASRSSWSSSVKRETPDSPLSASPPA